MRAQPALPALPRKITANHKPQGTLPGFRGFLGHSLPDPVALTDVAALVVTIPGIVLRSQNQQLRGASRGARMGAAAKIKKQRADVTMVLNASFRDRPAPPLVITVTRIAPGTLDAHDNLPAACKAIVDSIAAWLGLDDRDPGLSWKYSQVRDGKSYGITIRIESRPA